MTILHLEATGLTLSTLVLLSVMLSSHQNKLYLVTLASLTTILLFSAITSWFCLFRPADIPRVVVHWATTASWWVLPLFAGVLVYLNYSQASDAEKAVMRIRLGVVLTLGLLLTVGLFCLAL